MNRRVPPKKVGAKVEEKERLCGECKLLVPIMEQWLLSYKGKPTVGDCIHSTRRKRLLSEQACDKFEEKL